MSQSMLEFVTILVKFCFWDSCAGLILWPFLLLENKINRLKINSLVKNKKIANHQKDKLYKDQKRYEYVAIIVLPIFLIMFAITLWSIIGVRHTSIWF